MTQATERPDLDIKCAKARPWVRRFVEDYEDGRPWGYGIYYDPAVDIEKMDRGMGRISTLVRIAQVAVYGGDHRGFPEFDLKILDWPGETDEGPGGVEGNGEAGGEAVANVASGQTSPDTEAKIKNPEPTSAISSSEQAAQQQSDEDRDAGAIVKGTERDSDYDDLEDVDPDAEIDLGSEDTEEENEEDHDHQEANDDDSEESEESKDDADIDLVRKLPKLREHFRWLCQQTKRRRVGQSQNIDRSGMPHGLLHNVFLVVDEDSIDSILGNPPIVDNAWVWAIDPDYTSDVVSMTKDGLRDEHYGYMRVRVQQLVNNFWAALYQNALPLSALWVAAKQSHNCAFVSIHPEEAQLCKVSFDVGSALRATDLSPVHSASRVIQEAVTKLNHEEQIAVVQGLARHLYKQGVVGFNVLQYLNENMRVAQMRR